MRTKGPVVPDKINFSKGLQLLIRPLDRAQMFSVVSKGSFPCGSNRIPNW
jgi:hypothetical protein